MSAIHKTARRSRALRFAIDVLESRRLLSSPEATLSLSGTPGADTIQLDFQSGMFRYTLNGVTTLYPSLGVTSVRIDALAGGDWINIERDGGAATDVIGGDDTDNIHLSYYAENLSNLTGYTRVFGGNSLDTMTVWDRSVGGSITYDLDAVDVNRLNFGGAFYGADVETLNVYPNQNSTINIASTDANTDVGLFFTGTLNSTTLGTTPDGVRQFFGDVRFNSLGGAITDLFIDDAGDGNARVATLNVDPDDYAILGGVAPIQLSWPTAVVDDVTIRTGSAADTVNVGGILDKVTLDSSGGADRVNVGNDYAGVQTIQNVLQVHNSPDYTTLLVDDGTNTLARTVAVDVTVVGGVTFNSITGLSPGTILYDSADIAQVSIRGGSGNDTINVLRSTEDLTVTTSYGSDVVNVGNPVTGVTEILGPLHVTNPADYTTLSISDAGDTVARSATIDTAGSLGTLVGLAPGQIDWVTADIGGAGITITTGNSVDTVNVRRLSTGMRLTNPTIAGDIVRVGGPIYGTNYISASLLIENPGGYSSLEIDDQVGTSPRAVTFDYENISGADWGRIDGLGGMAGHVYYKLADTASPVIYRSGSASDSFRVERASVVGLDIRGGGGNDSFQLTANNAKFIQAPVSLSGDAGTDECYVMDTASVDGNGFAVNGTLIARGGMSNVNCLAMENLYIYAGGGAAKTHTVLDTAPGYGVYLMDGASTDTIVVEKTDGAPVYLQGTSLDDDLVTSTAGASTVILPATATYLRDIEIRGNGVVYVGLPTETVGDGQKVLTVTDWIIESPGRIDLGAHSLVLEYTTPGSVDPFHSLNVGYGTGTWNGFGLLTRFGDASNYALGYGEAADLLGPAGGNFHGVPVDGTAYLVTFTRYGDANLDRAVNISDFARLAANFNMPGRWTRGNFNYDAIVNISDFSLMASNFNRAIPADLPLRSPQFSRRLIDDVELTTARA